MTPTVDSLRSLTKERLPFAPTAQQAAVLDALCRFVTTTSDDERYRVFILNGYAGTGKTSLMGAFVGALEATKIRVVLMAPTGRAAKVLSANAGGRRAYTIHRRIYRHQVPGADGVDFSVLAPAVNPEHDAVYIVDEASMISDDDKTGLLQDLVQYVYGGEGCRMILLGDTAQLPPVGSDRSPAMNPDALRALGLKVSHATMTATVRQRRGSGILANATQLRLAMMRCAEALRSATEAGLPAPDLSAFIPKIHIAGYDDVAIVGGEELPELLERAYASGIDDAIVITRSNKRAVEYNKAIRSRILWREEELSTSDLLIVSRNHYFSGRKPGGIDFIANGDIISIEKIYGTEVRYGMRFADVTIRLGDDVITDTKIMLDTLLSEHANLAPEQWNALYNGILADNERYGAMTQGARAAALPRDPYWTALQVKYAYAVTCHKAQGGQWKHVFVDLSYIPADAIGLPLYRWLYTAVTRARQRLYLISPPTEMTGLAQGG